jgi:hypothetical protein
MTNYHTIFSNINCNGCTQITAELHIILNLLLQQLVFDTVVTCKTCTVYVGFLKSTACVALVRKAADEIRITIFLKSFGVWKINELVVTSNKLTNNFDGLVTSGLGPDMARGLPV